MHKTFHDLETFSPTPLKNGTHAYAEQAEVLLWAYSVDETAPISVWDVASGASMPDDLRAIIADPEAEVWWHNGGMFDRIVLKHAMPEVYVQLSLSRWRDTMVQALSHGLPGSLDKLSEVFKLPQDIAKAKEGKRYIQLFCKPLPKNSQLRRATAQTHPEEWAGFVQYAAQDIAAMRELHRLMPQWNYPNNAFELALWQLDQRINDCGIPVDVEFAQAAVRAIDTRQDELSDEAFSLTDGAVSRATQRDKMLAHLLEAYGIKLKDMRKSTVEKAVHNEDLPLTVRRLLNLRLEATATSTAKYKALLKTVSSDGRLRGTMQFNGAARTGRTAHRLFQPGNLPRLNVGLIRKELGILAHEPIKTYHKKDYLELGRLALKQGIAEDVFTNITGLASNTLRTCIAAPPGKKLVVSDLSNIEGRVAALLAGEEWKLEAFKKYDDGKGPDLYKVAASRAFGLPIKDITDELRQIGKVQELACFTASTKVLTSAGIKNLIDVQKTERLWDGVEWVQHQGIVAKGIRQVIRLNGIELTADHLILTGKTWQQAKQLVLNENILRQALETGSASLPWWLSSARKKVPATKIWYGSRALAAPPRILYLITIYAKGKALAARNALGKLAGTGVRIFGSTQISYLTTRIADVFSTEFQPVLTVAATKMTGDTQTTAVAASMCLKRGAPIGKRFWRISPLWKAGIIRICKWIDAMWTAITNPAICALSRIAKIKITAEKYKHCNNASQNWKPVYDIVLAGPRNRFTVVGVKGPLIAHNCGYGGGAGAFATMVLTYNLNLDDIQTAVQRNLHTIGESVYRDVLEFYEWAEKNNRTVGLSKDNFIACDIQKRLWRNANANIANYWKQLEDSVRVAIAEEGKTIKCGPLFIRRTKAWLRITLPSGRELCYPHPRIEEEGRISYMGVESFTKKWMRISTYGGKLFENVTQAAARDAFFYALPQIESAGYQPILLVHDEVVTETDDDSVFTEAHLSELLTSAFWVPKSLPLAAAGFEDYIYRKG